MIHFGTGGWRAIIADQFTKRNIQILSLALARKMRAENKGDKGIVIGYDRRFMSDLASEWICEVLISEGIPCYLMRRPAPTPMIMYAVEHYELHYGIAVTASHNPAIYNGVKLFTTTGRDAVPEVTEDLEKFIREVEDEIATNGEKVYKSFSEIKDNDNINYINAFNPYIDSILRQLNQNVIKKASLRIALDPMFGVSRNALQTILMTMRCEVDVIHDSHDTLFGGKLPAPADNTLDALISYVKDNQCDIGIATDGDADRVGIIDDKGRFIHPNQLLVLLYYYLLKYKGWRGPVVRNVATTSLLDKVAKDFGQECYEVPVGFKWVSEKMDETNAIIGGESSGGLTVKGHIHGKDGIYASSLLVEMVATCAKKLSAISEEIMSMYGPAHMVEGNLQFERSRKAEIEKIIMEDKQIPNFSFEVDRVEYPDGCKIYFKDGWLICRFSGTEPLLRIFCEMPEKEMAEQAIKEMKEFLNL